MWFRRLAVVLGASLQARLGLQTHPYAVASPQGNMPWTSLASALMHAGPTLAHGMWDESKLCATHRVGLQCV